MGAINLPLAYHKGRTDHMISNRCENGFYIKLLLSQYSGHG